jgi:hypothetical protein
MRIAAVREENTPPGKAVLCPEAAPKFARVE